jgi:hypothetical protein
MKRVEKCINEDCIPTPSGCVKWNGGDIPFLGICEGDCLNALMIELVEELKKIAGKDLSTFDINSLLAICKKKAPEEITITSILTLLRDNQLCLKEFADELEAQLQKLFENKNVQVNLQCYKGFNGIGLSITRSQLDQLIVDVLCNHKADLDSIDSTFLRLQEAINEARRSLRIEEVQVATCINLESLPLSVQIQNTSKELCDYLLSIGTPADIVAALANTPTDLNAEFGAISGWNSSPTYWSEFYSNTLLEVQNLRERLGQIEDVCCAVTCDDVFIGFTALMNEDGTGVILRFTKGAGMVMPSGFEDCGSTGTITDSSGNTQDFDVAISVGGTAEIPLEGLQPTGELNVNISAKICNTDKGIECHKCVSQTVTQTECDFCVLTASGNVTITYRMCSGISILN